MKRRVAILFGLLMAAILAIGLGPRPTIDETIRFDAAQIGADVDQWIAKREAAVPSLKDGAQKEIVWADPATKARTPIAIVYIHGFSATKWEVRPVPDILAKALGANLFYTRLAGHGGDGELLASATMNAWVNDLAEAIAIGEKLGDKVVIVSGSTGGTISAWGAMQSRLMNKVVGMAMISPNFEIRGASTGMLNMPWGETILPMVMGQTRSWDPHNEEHGKWWTTSYPSKAVFAMGALLKSVASKDLSKAQVPLLVIYSPKDSVVDPAVTLKRYEQWGAAKQIIKVEDSTDPNNHVIAGDILSPNTTERIAGQIIEWVRTLQ